MAESALSEKDYEAARKAAAGPYAQDWWAPMMRKVLDAYDREREKLAKLGEVACARLASRHSTSCDLLVHPEHADVIFPCSCGHDDLWAAMGCPEVGTPTEHD